MYPQTVLAYNVSRVFLFPSRLNLVKKSNNLTWYSNACFHSSLVLLLRSAQHLTSGVSRESVLQDLSYVRACLKVLELCCEEQDIAAMRFLNLLVPAYQCLSQIVDNHAIADGKTTDSMSLTSKEDGDYGSSIPARLAHVVHQLVAATRTRYQELWV